MKVCKHFYKTIGNNVVCFFIAVYIPEHDLQGKATVAIVKQSLAYRLFVNASPDDVM